MLKFLLALALALCHLLPVPGAEAAFDHSDGKDALPSLAVMEATSYRTDRLAIPLHDLQGGKMATNREYHLILNDGHFQTFEGKLHEHLQTIGGVSVEMPPAPETAAESPRMRSELHMACILASGHVNDIQSNAKLNAFYINRYKNPPSVQKIDKRSFRFTGAEAKQAKSLAAASGARYLLFCNLHRFFAKRSYKQGQVPLLPTMTEKVNLHLTADYYLVDSSSGRVFHDRCEVNESSRTTTIAAPSLPLVPLKAASQKDPALLLDEAMEGMAKAIAQKAAKKIDPAPHSPVRIAVPPFQSNLDEMRVDGVVINDREAASDHLIEALLDLGKVEIVDLEQAEYRVDGRITSLSTESEGGGAGFDLVASGKAKRVHARLEARLVRISDGKTVYIATGKGRSSSGSGGALTIRIGTSELPLENLDNAIAKAAAEVAAKISEAV